MLRVVFSIVFVLLTCPVYAGEIHFLGGLGATNNPVETTGVWQVRYMEGLGENFAYSLSYVNQGHFISHHRDGTAASLWLRTNQMDGQLSLGVGAGPIFYYDTVRPPNEPPTDVHGWGTMVNLLASWYTKNRWIYQLKPVQYCFSLINTVSCKCEKMKLTQNCCVSEGSIAGKSMF
jgi:hypothetical protein